MTGEVIRAQDVAKRFRIYHERNQSLKIAMMRRRRAKYDEFWALDDVSFDVKEGTTFGLVGHNGSGKSTMLKVLARILAPDRGTVAVTGKVSALLELGAGFHPELSGRDNVYLNGSILGLSRDEITRRFDDIVGFAGLEEFIDTPVKNYSSGMYVRLGFSVAINVDPDILMIDEVLAVGDEEFQRKCMEKFRDFKDEGRTIVVVSHALGTVRDLCDEVAWLDHGRLLGVGRPNEIVDEYVDSTHADREERPDGPSGNARHGSGEVRIEAVELLHDAEGQQPHTGDKVTFRLHYVANADVPGVVFGIGLHTVSGQHITGPNTKDAGLQFDVRRGGGTVDLEVERLMLLPGTYDLSTGVVDSTLVHTFDQQTRALRFDVLAGEPAERFGVVSMGGIWNVKEGAV